MSDEMICDRAIQQLLGLGETLINLRFVTAGNDQPERLRRQAKFDSHFFQRRLRLAMLRLQGVSTPVQPRSLEAQHRARAHKNQTGQQKRGARTARPRDGTRGRAARAPGHFSRRRLLRRDEIIPPMEWRLIRARLAAVGKQRRQINHHHHQRRHADADGHQRAELAEAGQSAEIQNQERAHRGDGRPQNARRDCAADFRHRHLRVSERLLIMHDGIIHRQTQQHGGETKRDHADRAQHQRAQRERREQNQTEQREQPQRCVSQNKMAMTTAVPPTERLMSCCMLEAISCTKTGRPV